MLKSLGKRLALAGGTLAILALLLEIVTRLIGHTGPDLTVADPVLGRRYLAGYDGDVYVPEAGKSVRLRFHQDGFRGPDRPRAKEAGVRRIALVGDSFVLAAGVDEEGTTVELLEAMLDGWDTDHRWESLNFGMSGSSTGQELVLYRELVHRYQPDIVILAFAVINDLADNSRRMSSGAAIYFELDERGGVRQLPVVQRPQGTSEWINRNSRFYVWQKFALRDLRFKLRESARVVKPGKRIFSTESDDGDLDHAWELSSRLLETFAREVEANGSRFVLAAVPAPEEVYDDRWQQILHNAGDAAPAFDREHPNRRLSAIAASAGIPIITMTDRFRAYARSASLTVESEQLYLSGIGHLNDAGNRLLAEALFEWLAEDLAEGGI